MNAQSKKAPESRDTTIGLAGGGELVYIPRFLSEKESAEAYRTLRATLSWEQRVISIFGKRYPQPRLIAWVGDFSYSYSGLTLSAAPWPEVLLRLREKVEERVFGESEGQYRGVLLNYYRDGLDSIGMHADDEPEILSDSAIASLSLGATRRLRLRYQAGRREGDEKPAGLEIDLEDGSLLLMQGTTQRFWHHGIPKEPRVREGRINLTFRRYGGS